MLRVLVAACALLLAGASLPRAGAAAMTVDGSTLGQLEAAFPLGEPRGLVFLFSEEHGATPELAAAAAKLVALDLIVAPVPLRPFLDRQDALGRQCLYLVSDIEETSRRIQAAGGRGRYLTPILAGTGMGAAVAYAALAQSPAATLAGAAGDGFTTRIATRAPLCAGAPFTPVAGGFEYGPAPLPGWWRVAADQTEAAEAFTAAAGVEDALIAVPEGGPGDRLAALIEPALSTTVDQGLVELPLVELPVTTPGRLMAVVYSGDGGWRDIDKDIADQLQRKGIPVVGVDSLRYFWSEKAPEQVAADLDRIMSHYRAAWDRPDVLLIGYSFGADALPFAYNRLPAQQRAQVVRIALLGSARSADFEIHVTGWLGVAEHAGSRPTAPELAQLPPALVQCFYGEQEDDTACTLAELEGARLVKTAGGHHFDGDYGKLADEIVAGMAR